MCAAASCGWGPSVIDEILTRHAYPPTVARRVGEAAALTVLLGAALKSEGRLQLQTRSDGIIDMIVVDFDAPDRLRAFARFDEARLAEAAPGAELLGRGHLALTIEHGQRGCALSGRRRAGWAGARRGGASIFRQSEQIPTFVRLAVAESLIGGATTWRAGGLLLQFLPASIERQRRADLAPGDAPAGASVPQVLEDDAWAGSQGARRDARRSRARRSQSFKRALALPALLRARRQGLRGAAGPRRLPLFGLRASPPCCAISPSKSATTWSATTARSASPANSARPIANSIPRISRQSKPHLFGNRRFGGQRLHDGGARQHPRAMRFEAWEFAGREIEPRGEAPEQSEQEKYRRPSNRRAPIRACRAFAPPKRTRRVHPRHRPARHARSRRGTTSMKAPGLRPQVLRAAASPADISCRGRTGSPEPRSAGGRRSGDLGTLPSGLTARNSGLRVSSVVTSTGRASNGAPISLSAICAASELDPGEK